MHDIERFIFTPADTLGSDFIQYSFAERDGRLFVWMDSTAVVTQELIDVLEKYNFIELSLIVYWLHYRLFSLELYQ